MLEQNITKKYSSCKIILILLKYFYFHKAVKHISNAL
jgi:hypothetical protein